MKKFNCFWITNVVSILLFILIGFTLNYKSVLSGIVDRDGVDIMILQGLFLIKYLTLLLILLPAKINLNQLAVGFLSADITMAILSVLCNSIFPVPLCFLILQGVILLTAAWLYGGYVFSPNINRVPVLKNKFLTEGF